MVRKRSPETKDQFSDSPIQQFFVDLTTPESATLITPEVVDGLRDQVRTELSAAGVNFDTLASRETLSLLKERQLRGYDTGKGAAIVAATPEGFVNRFQAWAMTESSKLPKLKHGDESSRCRGLMQIMANTIAFAAGAIDSQNYLTELKWRVGASYERPLKKKTERAEKASSERRLLQEELKHIRDTYGIPSPKQQPDRDNYVDYSRVKPLSMHTFWTNLIEIASQQ